MDLFKLDVDVRAKNGIRVFVKNLPGLSGWCQIRAIVSVGSRHDPVGEEGLAHFFEHMPYNGTEKMTDHEIVKKVARKVLVGHDNANTWVDRTVYEGAAARENYPAAMDYFSELIFRPLLNAERIENERKVILREFWKNLDTPKNAAKEKECHRDVFGDNNLGRAGTLGWAESIQAIPAASFGKFHARYYCPANITLLFVGDVTEAEALAMAERFCGDRPVGERSAFPEVPEVWPDPAVNLREYSASADLGAADRQTTEIEYTRLVSPLINRHAMALFGMLLQDRLYEQIREKLGSIYSPRLHSIRFWDHRIFIAKLDVEPSTEGQVRGIFEGIIGGITGKNDEFRPLFEELKEKRLSNWRFLELSSDQLADQMVDIISTESHMIWQSAIIEGTKETTYGDVVELVRQEFRPSQIHCAIVRP